MSKIRVRAAVTSGDERKQYVTRMFDSIAKNYDFLNHLLSGGLDIIWRRRASKLLELNNKSKHLDLACGTADFALIINERYKTEVIASDISKEMLRFADKKISKKGRGRFIKTEWADAEALPFNNSSFDSVSIGFGIRNFGDSKKALLEINRVLKPGGQLIILEFSTIRTPIIGDIFAIYFKYILPKIGAIFSTDKDAYTYLPDSVESFPSQTEFIELITRAGLTKAYYKNYMFGICSLFYAEKIFPDKQRTDHT